MENLLLLIIGAILSYLTYMCFTIRNLKKCLIENIKVKLKQPAIDGFGYSGHLSKLSYYDYRAKKLISLCDDINNSIYKLTGKPDKKCTEIGNKLFHLYMEIERINKFIDVYITLVMQKDRNDPNIRLKIENTFYCEDITKRIKFKSTDIKIQKEFDEFFMKNGVDIDSTISIL